MLKRPPDIGRLRAGPLEASKGTSRALRPGQSRRCVVSGLLGALIASTCLLTTAGVASASATSSSTLYGWGSNSYGELGDGSTNNRTSPEPASLAPGIAPTAISAGVGFALAIGSDGNLYTWGTGYLGDGSDKAQNSPKKITLASGVTGVGDRESGRIVFMTNCATCHGATGLEGGVGPSLRDERQRKNDDATIAWIADPAPPMPKLYPSILTKSQVVDVATYVQSL